MAVTLTLDRGCASKPLQSGDRSSRQSSPLTRLAAWPVVDNSYTQRYEMQGSSTGPQMSLKPIRRSKPIAMMRPPASPEALLGLVQMQRILPNTAYKLPTIVSYDQSPLHVHDEHDPAPEKDIQRT